MIGSIEVVAVAFPDVMFGPIRLTYTTRLVETVPVGFDMSVTIANVILVIRRVRSRINGIVIRIAV